MSLNDLSCWWFFGAGIVCGILGLMFFIWCALKCSKDPIDGDTALYGVKENENDEHSN